MKYRCESELFRRLEAETDKLNISDRPNVEHLGDKHSSWSNFDLGIGIV